MPIPFWNWKSRVITIAVNLAVIGIFAALGWALDVRFGTRPKLLAAGVLISFPISQFLLVKILLKGAKGNKNPAINKEH